ncbi:UDP-Glycosyltransferase/glycogen phosphorylase [Piromyces finnis]|uniref:UDP-Glycosyltransferase/glycogen phosphorylase n=1 Tax=Piromyces finnis TaxID=1754191 RepID=A0A1Y1VCM0_9FUNG|nr:UDP-Glycosyltransferase/glycogen phosphorylase [Piromyces finnis]|eukprot:ORX52936.1 UDP-Glycosyltransferase/glycogen phosphorylase [Piromyces finnis]
MKILISPMSAIAETAGPFSRCKKMAEAFTNAGIEVATCIAKDVNYREIQGIPNYYLDIPMPFGMPKFIASRTFPMAQKLGITSRKTVNSFDQVFLFTGNLDYDYLKKSANSIPRGLNRLLRELGLAPVESALQLFDRADHCFCPSIKELEPIEKEGVTFCGTLNRISMEETNVNPINHGREDQENSPKKDKIIVYMGNGTISASKMKKEITKAFCESEYKVYIASHYLPEQTEHNIHIAKRWDFNKLLKESVLYINHGGQNSIMDGLLHGVPQLIVPGKVFERRYNAESLVKNQAGATISHLDFKAATIYAKANYLIQSKEVHENVGKLCEKLCLQGGIENIIHYINLNTTN